MKTVNVNIYTVDELSEKAFENAYELFSIKMEYPNHSDNIDTLYAIADLFDINFKNWEYDEYRFHFSFKTEIDLQGKELENYIIDNFYEYLMDRKEISGYYLDWVFLNSIKNDIAEIGEKTYYELMYNALRKTFACICDDMQNYYSIENFKELSEVNEWYFTDEGEFYN